jgi:hypothetical protein
MYSNQSLPLNVPLTTHMKDQKQWVNKRLTIGLWKYILKQFLKSEHSIFLFPFRVKLHLILLRLYVTAFSCCLPVTGFNIRVVPNAFLILMFSCFSEWLKTVSLKANHIGIKHQVYH